MGHRTETPLQPQRSQKAEEEHRFHTHSYLHCTNYAQAGPIHFGSSQARHSSPHSRYLRPSFFLLSILNYLSFSCFKVIIYMLAAHVEEEQDETYMGYEKWLPTPPKVVKPRSVFNAATLAYIGDCIYEVCFEAYL